MPLDLVWYERRFRTEGNDHGLAVVEECRRLKAEADRERRKACIEADPTCECAGCQFARECNEGGSE